MQRCPLMQRAGCLAGAPGRTPTPIWPAGRPSLRVCALARPHRARSTPPSPTPAPSRIPLSLLGLGAITGGGLLGTGFDISGPESVLEALGVLAAVVGVHETGHFLAARLQGIHVNRFAIGFGPSLIQFKRGEVEYSLRALPLGGFVSFPDDDPECPYPKDDPNLLRNRPVLDRAIVTSAGVIANLIFAYAICVVQAAAVGVAQPQYLPGVRLGSISPGTVAAEAGLRRGDVVLRVGDLKVAPSPSAVGDVVGYIQQRAGKPLDIEITRDGAPLSLSVTPAEMADGSGRIGVSLGANVKIDRKKADGVGSALALGAKDFANLGNTVLRGLAQFFSNFKETAERVSGPVAILAVGSEVARTDVTGLYQFAALINLNLAVVNVLPLPALDGGSLVLLGIEAATGRALDRDTEALVNYAGYAFFVLAGIWLFTRDLENLAGSLLQGRGYLALQLLEALRGGKKLDVEVEKGIMASGFLLLTSLGMFLIVRDAISLLS